MATKRITELTLRSDFGATCNVPVDDTIQSYRVTGAQILDYIRNHNGLLVSKTANYTILDDDDARTVLMTTSTTDKTVTLPTASDNANRIITVKKVDSDSGIVIVEGEGAETIEGESSISLSVQNDAITVQCDGIDWLITGDNRVMYENPTVLPDSVATAWGRKVYYLNTAYNGGITPTCTRTGTQTNRGMYIPWQAQDGSWWLKLHLEIVSDSGSGIGDGVYSLNGFQVMYSAYSTRGLHCEATGNDGNPALTLTAYLYASGSDSALGTDGSTSRFITVSGEVPLTGKPTWAY